MYQRKMYSKVFLSGVLMVSLMLPCVAAAADKVVVVPLGGAKYYMYWQGDWTVDTSYKIGDGVQYGGSSYVCVQAHQSSNSDDPPSAYWDLLALKGDPGVDGTDGTNGTNGIDGTNGTNGVDGTNGANGVDGTNGTNGVDGTNGTNGVDGTNGTNGVDGTNGTNGVDGTNGTDGATGPAGPVGQAKGLSIGNEVTHTIDTTTYTWLDRNLGASQVASSSADTLAYGDLYQWGRGVDGHESRTSPTTTILSSSDSPKHDNFIISSSSPYDWRSPQNDNLWQGVDGINNPCPSGFRLPTATEWDTERAAWVTDGNTNDAAGAYGSPLKLVVEGDRDRNDGSILNAGSYGVYWSSTVDGSSSRNLNFNGSSANMDSSNRANGFSVRCLKD